MKRLTLSELIAMGVPEAEAKKILEQTREETVVGKETIKGYKLAKTQSEVRELPKVKIRGKLYYRDDRLREFRNVDNPHDRIEFEEVGAYATAEETRAIFGTVTMEQLQKELGGFTGTQYWHRHFTGLLYTDGIEHLAKRAEAYWLIDAIFSYQDRRVREIPFQLWTLKVKPDKTAELTMREDIDRPVVIKQDIPFTDFPEGEIKLYVEGPPPVLLLPSEH